MRVSAPCMGLIICAIPLSSLALDDKYHITPEEKAACSSDALRLCSNTYPDEDRLFSCMKENRASLSAVCRVAFDAGRKRRRL